MDRGAIANRVLHLRVLCGKGALWAAKGAMVYQGCCGFRVLPKHLGVLGRHPIGCLLAP